MGPILRGSVIAILCLCASCRAAAPARHWRWLERDWGSALVLRPYRSYGSLFVDLDKERDFTLWEEDEFKLYRDLVRRSVRPGYFLVELTGYPLTAFSAWLAAEHGNTYHWFDIGGRFNLVRSLGAGNQEPWSASVFLGQLATFWNLNEQDELVVAARGVAGPVATAGTRQLFDNRIVKAGWYRVDGRSRARGLRAPGTVSGT